MNRNTKCTWKWHPLSKEKQYVMNIHSKNIPMIHFFGNLGAFHKRTILGTDLGWLRFISISHLEDIAHISAMLWKKRDILIICRQTNLAESVYWHQEIWHEYNFLYLQKPLQGIFSFLCGSSYCIYKECHSRSGSLCVLHLRLLSTSSKGFITDFSSVQAFCFWNSLCVWGRGRKSLLGVKIMPRIFDAMQPLLICTLYHDDLTLFLINSFCNMTWLDWRNVPVHLPELLYNQLCMIFRFYTDIQ